MSGLGPGTFASQRGGSGLCLVFGLRDGGGGGLGQKKVCVPEMGLTFFSIQKFISEEVFFLVLGWGRVWPGGGEWIRQIPPPPPPTVDKHVPDRQPNNLGNPGYGGY